jgi:hypothetical protein
MLTILRSSKYRALISRFQAAISEAEARAHWERAQNRELRREKRCAEDALGRIAGDLVRANARNQELREIMKDLRSVLETAILDHPPLLARLQDAFATEGYYGTDVAPDEVPL